VPDGYDPERVPVYDDIDTRDREYEAAQSAGEPFFAVERYPDGYAITYDLLPAGRELTLDAYADLSESLTAEVEAVVADETRPTTEVRKTVGESLGSVSYFASEESAREVAAAISTTVLDPSNWVEATPPSDPSDGGQSTGLRRN